MSISANALFDEVLVYAPGCQTSVLRKELLRSAQRFCRKSFTLTRKMSFRQASGLTQASLSRPLAAENLAPIKPIEVTVNGRVIGQVSLDRLRAGNPFYNLTPNAEPRVYYSEGEGSISFYPTPDLDVVVAVTVAAYPTDGYSGLPDELVGQYQDAIVGGALERICAMPQQVYTNAEYSMMGRMWFNDGLAIAKINFNNSYGRDMAVQQTPFVRGHRRF